MRQLWIHGNWWVFFFSLIGGHPEDCYSPKTLGLGLFFFPEKWGVFISLWNINIQSGFHFRGRQNKELGNH